MGDGVRETGDGVCGGERLWIWYLHNGGSGDEGDDSAGRREVEVDRVGVGLGESGVA
jgi:hypothetical protein